MLKHHSGFSWYGILVSQLGMLRMMAVVWTRVATSVLRMTPVLTMQQVFTCVGHRASAISSSVPLAPARSCVGDSMTPTRPGTPTRCHRAEGEAAWGFSWTSLSRGTSELGYSAQVKYIPGEATQGSHPP